MKRSLLTKALMAVVSLAFISTAGLQAEAAGTAAASQKLETAKQNYLASMRSEALKTNSHLSGDIHAGSPSEWLTRVEPSSVNMVTNRVEEAGQTAVNLEGNSYFVSGESYAWTLKQNQSLRYSIDPLTNRKVDKARAVIFADASGRVFYFESEQTYRDFLATAAPVNDTVFGYSEPE